jgi:DHA1 family multidrug resistance protein-like MFS transporter
MSGLVGSLSARAAGLGRGLDRSLALLAAIAFITQIGVAVMLPLLPLYATQLGATPRVLGLLTSSFAAGANAAANLWQEVDIHAGVLVIAAAAVCAGLVMFALPGERWSSPAGDKADVGTRPGT